MTRKGKGFLQGVQKKSVILGRMPITGLGRGLEIKVGGVLKSSENFLSNDHRNFVFLATVGAQEMLMFVS